MLSCARLRLYNFVPNWMKNIWFGIFEFDLEDITNSYKLYVKTMIVQVFPALEGLDLCYFIKNNFLFFNHDTNCHHSVLYYECSCKKTIKNNL